MNDHDTPKRRRLRKAGLFHLHPERVRDRWFMEFPEFFDACDLLQVRYEILRAHAVGGEAVVDVCKRFGISRQTFYTLHEKFARSGTAGLLPERPGPHGPSKLTPEVVAFAEQHLQDEPDLSGSELATRIEERFKHSLHKRTAEKLLRQLRSKKNS
jgi:transposase